MTQLQKPLSIIGVALRTSNDNGRAFHEIPPFWERFRNEECMARIPGKFNNDVYAVYTNFENEGKNNYGMYTLIVGCSGV